jgi:hypothetical protein
MLAIPERLYLNSEEKCPSNLLDLGNFTILRIPVDRFNVL